MTQQIRRIVDSILALPQFPLAMWSCSDDASGTALTLDRQKRWIVTQIKERFGKLEDRPLSSEPDIEDLRSSLARLVAAVDNPLRKEDYTAALNEAKTLLNIAPVAEPTLTYTPDEGIIDDCHQAAKFYSSGIFGRKSEEIKEELRRRFVEDDFADPLMTLFAQHREKYTKMIPEGFIQIPADPTEEMWDGLPRHLINWLRQDLPITPKSLFSYLGLMGCPHPQWLIDELGGENPTHSLAKGTLAVLIFKAMVDQYTPCLKIKQLEKELPALSIRCTCLSELAHDAYSPGGPMSGHPLPPPCQLHP